MLHRIERDERAWMCELSPHGVYEVPQTWAGVGFSEGREAGWDLGWEPVIPTPPGARVEFPGVRKAKLGPSLADCYKGKIINISIIRHVLFNTLLPCFITFK